MSDAGGTDVPVLVPARMVNEFSYCPRLFHMEWVQARFEHNADTAEGAWRHRVVDEPAGLAPLPSDAAELKRATSVTVGSERLGLVAVIDVLEAANGKVRPVDVKKGRPPSHGPAWEPELVQLCVQGLLLREQGYECDEGVLSFSETNERRTIPFDDALIEQTLRLVGELREVAASEVPPPPLVDSRSVRDALLSVCVFRTRPTISLTEVCAHPAV